VGFAAWSGEKHDRCLAIVIHVASRQDEITFVFFFAPAVEDGDARPGKWLRQSRIESESLQLAHLHRATRHPNGRQQFATVDGQ